MARYACSCGNTLSNIDDMEDPGINVYDRKAVDQAMEENEDLLLMDVYYEYPEQYEITPNYFLMHCDKCHRAYAFVKGSQLDTLPKEEQKKVPDYAYEPKEEGGYSLEDMKDWKEVYVFTELPLYWTTDADQTLTMNQFLKDHPPKYRYFIAPGHKKVCSFDAETGELFCVYVERECWFS